MSLRATAEIFRTIKMRSIMDIPPHKVPQCLSGRHRLDRRALYQIRIFQERQADTKQNLPAGTRFGATYRLLTGWLGAFAHPPLVSGFTVLVRSIPVCYYVWEMVL